MPPHELPSLPDFVQLSDRVWRIMGLNPSLFCLQGTNTYLIGLGNRKILVDVSDENPDYVVLLQKSLKSISPDAYISDILISHCHHDHWRSLPSIMKSSQNDPPIRVHKYPLPPNSEDITSHMDDFPRDIPLQDLYDRQVFHIDQGNDKTTTLHVIYTPGHADDHCSFWLEEEKTLLAGDCVIGHGTTLVNDVKDYVTSLETLASFHPRRLYPGHGAVVENGMDLIQDNLAYRRKKEAQIIKVLGSPLATNGGLTSWDIASVIYDGKIDPLTEHLIVWGILRHLVKLAKEGRARLVDDCVYDPKNLHRMFHCKWYYIEQPHL